MEQVLSVLQAVLPVFTALFLGMLCRKTNFLSREGIDNLKKVVVNITLPAVLFGAFATAEYSISTIAVPVVTYILCLVILGVGFLLTRLFRIQLRVAPFFATGFEAGMLGYALFALLFPGVSPSKFAILDLGQTLFVFTAFKILLSGKTDWKAIGKDMVTSPILWAVGIGVVLGATGLWQLFGQWGVGGVISGVSDFVAAPTGMIILLTVGYDLVLREISWGKTLRFIGLRLIAMGVFVGIYILLNRTFLHNQLFEGAILLMAILPPPYVIPIFADSPEDRSQVSSALSALTLTCVLLFVALRIFL